MPPGRAFARPRWRRAAYCLTMSRLKVPAQPVLGAVLLSAQPMPAMLPLSRVIQPSMLFLMPPRMTYPNTRHDACTVILAWPAAMAPVTWAMF